MNLIKTMRDIKKNDKEYGKEANRILVGINLMTMELRSKFYDLYAVAILIIALITGGLGLMIKSPILIIAMVVFVGVSIFLLFVSIKWYYDRKTFAKAFAINKMQDKERLREINLLKFQELKMLCNDIITKEKKVKASKKRRGKK